MIEHAAEMLVEFNTDGSYKSSTHASQAGALLPSTGSLALVTSDPELLAAPPSHLRATIQDGRVAAVELAPPPEPEPCLYAHISGIGGDGQFPLGIAYTGTAERTANIAFKLALVDDPGAPAVQHPGTLKYRIRLYPRSQEQEPDINKVVASFNQRIAITAGEGAMIFGEPALDKAAPLPPGDYYLREDSFESVIGMKVKIGTGSLRALTVFNPE